ncbi:hypothetical protein BBOV_III001805 [Babesia bovis T2Bo]|uniref:hypothetical protein n=1 Tax=Babesia bovis T2Bo TaxID=484906 RepID=UPI001C3537A9|nr:hypothetical protein BBOV_III001805 [Babesia bovis T2Bo]KAG6440058.1 hypothetical protein BBOV_III001805 [Babesia bovis T2Bo]
MMASLVKLNWLYRPNKLFINRNVRYFSGRRVRRTTPNQMTPQEQLLLQQKLREMQLAQAQQPRKSGLLNTIKESVIHGLGFAFAQRMVDSIFGPRTINISDFTGSNNNVDTGSTNSANEYNNSPFVDDSNQDQGWSWGSDLFSEDE